MTLKTIHQSWTRAPEPSNSVHRGDREKSNAESRVFPATPSTSSPCCVLYPKSQRFLTSFMPSSRPLVSKHPYSLVSPRHSTSRETKKKSSLEAWKWGDVVRPEPQGRFQTSHTAPRWSPGAAPLFHRIIRLIWAHVYGKMMEILF